jgi:hypothetical protein
MVAPAISGFGGIGGLSALATPSRAALNSSVSRRMRPGDTTTSCVKRVVKVPRLAYPTSKQTSLAERPGVRSSSLALCGRGLQRNPPGGVPVTTRPEARSLAGFPPLLELSGVPGLRPQFSGMMRGCPVWERKRGVKL